MMASLSDVASDERTARMVLSMLVEPNDPVTGRILSRLGAVETLWLAERDGAVVGLSPVDAQVWRDHFDAPAAKELTARIDQVQQSGVRALIPGDADWPTALDDLGDVAPYVLWTRGASSFLSRPLQRSSSRSPALGHAPPTATTLPANSPLPLPPTNEWSSRAAPTGSKVRRTRPPSPQVATRSRSSPTESIARTLSAIATCLIASPMSAFSLARFRPAPFRPGTGSSPAPD